MDNFREESINFTKDFVKENSKNELKKQGIYFTPKVIRAKLLDQITKFVKPNINILEPAAGSGEFLNDINLLYGSVPLNIDAVELNTDLYNIISDIPNVNSMNEDFLLHNLNKEYELIVGNPPFFEVSRQSDYFELFEKEQEKEWFFHRTNIYSLFILKCIELLKPKGILAFVLPPSWMSGYYFEKVREALSSNGSILHLEDVSQCNNFMKTEQDTMLMVFRKGTKIKDKYKLNFNNNIFYTFHKPKLEKLLENTKNIVEFNCKVSTGKVVWNQHKDKLTSEEDEETIPLIYSCNIIDNNIVLQEDMNRGKQQYIKGDFKPITLPSIIINRGFGKGKSYTFSYALCTLPKYLCENHTNVIENSDINVLKIIEKSLNDPRTKEWCELFIGNGQLSKTELEYYLPIFTD
tara:strand:- start:12 stop:1232 length:1221 start_codon:yes stop_codon:yes gene_type:complete